MNMLKLTRQGEKWIAQRSAEILEQEQDIDVAEFIRAFGGKYFTERHEIAAEELNWR